VRVGALVDTPMEGVTSEFCGTGGPSLCAFRVKRDNEKEESCTGDSAATVAAKAGTPGIMVLLSTAAGESGDTGCEDAVPTVCTTVLRLPESASKTGAAEEDDESTRGREQ
jgi:hypothetical protein